MSEYIIDLYSEEDRAEVKRVGFDSCAVNGYRIKAEVVRCRDCVHYADHEWITLPQYGLGTDIGHVCHFWHGKPTKVEPDGFCAWGERTPNG